MNNLDLIKSHLSMYNSITKMEAAKHYNQFNLGEYIRRLRCRGYHIDTIIEEFRGKKYARYTLNNERNN